MDSTRESGGKSGGESSARDLARRLVIRAGGSPDMTGQRAIAAHAAGERAYRELSRTFGSVGADALLQRAMTEASRDHALLRNVRFGRQAKPETTGVMAMIAEHGDQKVAAALDAVLECWLTLLARLIGDDMVARLVGTGVGGVPHDDGAAQ